MFRVHTAKDLLSIVAGILEGEMQRTAGDLDARDRVVPARGRPAGGARLRRAGAAAVLGVPLARRRAVEAKRFDEAEKAYRAELKDHPHNGWSLLGLQQALEGMGKQSSEVAADLAASWSRSDTWIQSSRF